MFGFLVFHAQLPKHRAKWMAWVHLWAVVSNWLKTKTAVCRRFLFFWRRRMKFRRWVLNWNGETHYNDIADGRNLFFTQGNNNMRLLRFRNDYIFPDRKSWISLHHSYVNTRAHSYAGCNGVHLSFRVLLVALASCIASTRAGDSADFCARFTLSPELTRLVTTGMVTNPWLFHFTLPSLSSLSFLASGAGLSRRDCLSWLAEVVEAYVVSIVGRMGLPTGVMCHAVTGLQCQFAPCRIGCILGRFASRLLTFCNRSWMGDSSSCL